MNKSFTLRNAVLCSFFATTLVTACSKSSDDIADNSVKESEIAVERTRSVTITTSPFDVSDDRTFGSVKLTVTPLGDVDQIIIYNDNFTSDAFQFDPNTGEFQLSNVPTGTYSVIVVPNNDNYRKSNTDNVEITENTTADLGTIILEN